MTPRDTLQRLLIEHRTAHDMASREREILRMFEAAQAAERKRLCEALKIEMQHSAWDGVLQLDDALRNIADANAKYSVAEQEQQT